MAVIAKKQRRQELNMMTTTAMMTMIVGCKATVMTCNVNCVGHHYNFPIKEQHESEMLRQYGFKS